MNYLYCYYTPVDRFDNYRCFETSFTLSYEMAEKAINEGGHVKMYDARTNNAKDLIEVMTTMDEVEGRLAADERKHWFKETKSETTIKDIMEKIKQNVTEVKEVTGINYDNLVDNNIKTAAAAGKPSLAAVPPVGFFAMGAAMADGARKYGRFNWRETTVTSSVFYDAMMRHLLAWWNGEDHALDSLVHHLGHLQAGAAIIMDGELNGVLNDDRDSHCMVDIDKIMALVIKKA